MRVVVVGRNYQDSFAKCVGDSLEDMGYDACVIDERRLFPSNVFCGEDRLIKGYTLRAVENVLLRASPAFESFVYRRLIAKIEKYKPTLVIVLTGKIPPKVISRIKKRNCIKVVCWFPDHIGNLGKQYILATDYDALFFKDPFMVRVAREKIGRNAFYLPQCCYHRLHRPVSLSEKEKQVYGCDITTAGNMYYYRAIVFEKLLSGNYDIKLWGTPFPRWLHSPLRSVYQNRYVTGVEKAKAFIGAKVVLNLMAPPEIEGTNKRLFEVAGCGGFQLCDYKSTLPELFVPDKEVVVFHSFREMRDKIVYYVARPDERREIAHNAYVRAHRDHTYENRLRTILHTVSLGTGVDEDRGIK